MTRLILAIPLALAACAQPEPITDASVYAPGKAGLTSPMPRPQISATRIDDLRCHRPGQPERNAPWCGDETRAEPPVTHPEPPKPEKPKKPQHPKHPKKDQRS